MSNENRNFRFLQSSYFDRTELWYLPSFYEIRFEFAPENLWLQVTNMRRRRHVYCYIIGWGKSIIVNIIKGSICFVYFTFYYREHFVSEFSKPKFYIYSVVALFVHVLGYYIIKTCPNPAYFRVFITLQIIILFFATLYITEIYEVSIQSTIGLICGCIAILLISLDKHSTI